MARPETFQRGSTVDKTNPELQFVSASSVIPDEGAATPPHQMFALTALTSMGSPGTNMTIGSMNPEVGSPELSTNQAGREAELGSILNTPYSKYGFGC